MKIINYKVLTVALFFAVTSFSCQMSKQKRSSGNYAYETECYGAEGDGSVTVKAWGQGRNREDAIEQAMKNGMRDVIFKGLTAGKDECNVKPLIFEVNAQEKYEDYFFAFFKDNGEFRKYISTEDGSLIHPEVFKGRTKNGDQATYGVVIRILKMDLKQKLKTDNIIK